jgi:hypothetical protein
MTDFADDSPSIERKRSRVANDRVIKDNVIRLLMSRGDGRRFLWLLMQDCHMFEISARFGEEAVLKTYFSEGERNIGLRLLMDIMRLAPREYILSMEENSKVELEDGRRTRRSRDGDGTDDGRSPGDDDSITGPAE